MAVSRERLRELFRFAPPAVTLLSTTLEERDGYMLETLRFTLEGRGEVRGFVTRPLGAGPHPAILFGHSHGAVYTLGAEELLVGRDYLHSPPGPALARAGYVTLSIDMPAFGERATASEGYLSKALLWYGRSLFGQMLEDHSAALTYLASRPDVDARRIGAFGISMGCTLSYWLAAIDERIAATAHLCCFADFRTMIAIGAHDGHGIYLVVPGLLEEADAGDIAALVAPRPQLICIGEADPLTPPAAFERAWEVAKAAYAAQGGQLLLLREPGIGHQETTAMREAVLAFFRDVL